MLSKFSFHVCLVNKPLSIVTKDREMFGNVHVFILCNVGPIIHLLHDARLAQNAQYGIARY